MNHFTLIGQMITFTIFVWVILKYVLPPIMGAIEERQERIATGLAAADEADFSLKKAQEDSDAITVEAKRKSLDIVQLAESRANDIINKAKEDAVIEGGKQLELAKSEIEQEGIRLKEHLRKEVSQLVIDGTKKVVSKEIDASKHSELIKELASKL